MRAYVLHGVGDLRYEQVEEPLPKPGWCLVRVEAAGICSSDIPRIFLKGTYQFPTIPGHEFSGVVASVGSCADSEWIGRRVGIFPLIPCRECPQCAEGRYEMCESYDYVGSRRDGGFAELVAVPVWNLVWLPNSVSFEQAAMLEPLSVALHAVQRADIKKGEVVAVSGSGMIGFAAALWAKARGAGEVCVLGRSETKAKIADALGIDYAVSDESRWPLNPSVVIEAVGSGASLVSCIERVTPGGRIVCMGNPEGAISLPQDIYWRILRKQLMLIGTWNSSFGSPTSDDWTQALEFLADKGRSFSALITHAFRQDQLTQGLDLMRRRATSYCKVMTSWNQ